MEKGLIYLHKINIFFIITKLIKFLIFFILIQERTLELQF